MVEMAESASTSKAGVSNVADPNEDNNIWGERKPADSRLKRWAAAWSKGQTGWHLDKANRFLVDNLDWLSGGARSPLAKEGSTRMALVPLCGKSEDMMYLLSQGYGVVGVDGVDKPLLEFLATHNLEFREETTSVGKKFVACDGQLTLICCDIFNITPSLVGPVDFVYDRAALIALDPPDRKGYTDVIFSCLPAPGQRLLLITVAYDQSAMDGPPWSVRLDLAKQIYAERVSSVTLKTEHFFPKGHRFEARGAKDFAELVYAVESA